MRLLVIVLLLLGCSQQRGSLAQQRAEFKALLESSPQPSVPVPPPEVKPTGSPAAAPARPSTERAAVVYFVTGNGWCPPCLKWHPEFERAFQALRQQGYKVREARHTTPNPAHFVELVYPADFDKLPPTHRRLEQAAGGLLFPGFYAVSSDWRVLRSWSPDDAKETPWEGAKTLLWLYTGQKQ